MNSLVSTVVHVWCIRIQIPCRVIWDACQIETVDSVGDLPSNQLKISWLISMNCDLITLLRTCIAIPFWQHHVHFAILFGFFCGFSRPTASHYIISRAASFQVHQVQWNSSKLAIASSLHKQYLVVLRNTPIFVLKKAIICRNSHLI